MLSTMMALKHPKSFDEFILLFGPWDQGAGDPLQQVLFCPMWHQVREMNLILEVGRCWFLITLLYQFPFIADVPRLAHLLILKFDHFIKKNKIYICNVINIYSALFAEERSTLFSNWFINGVLNVILDLAALVFVCMAAFLGVWSAFGLLLFLL